MADTAEGESTERQRQRRRNQANLRMSMECHPCFDNLTQGENYITQLGNGLYEYGKVESVEGILHRKAEGTGTANQAMSRVKLPKVFAGIETYPSGVSGISQLGVGDALSLSMKVATWLMRVHFEGLFLELRTWETISPAQLDAFVESLPNLALTVDEKVMLKSVEYWRHLVRPTRAMLAQSYFRKSASGGSQSKWSQALRDSRALYEVLVKQRGNADDRNALLTGLANGRVSDELKTKFKLEKVQLNLVGVRKMCVQIRPLDERRKAMQTAAPKMEGHSRPRISSAGFSSTAAEIDVSNREKKKQKVRAPGTVGLGGGTAGAGTSLLLPGAAGMSPTPPITPVTAAAGELAQGRAKLQDVQSKVRVANEQVSLISKHGLVSVWGRLGGLPPLVIFPYAFQCDRCRRNVEWEETNPLNVFKMHQRGCAGLAEVEAIRADMNSGFVAIGKALAQSPADLRRIVASHLLAKAAARGGVSLAAAKDPNTLLSSDLLNMYLTVLPLHGGCSVVSPYESAIETLATVCGIVVDRDEQTGRIRKIDKSGAVPNLALAVSTFFQQEPVAAQVMSSSVEDVAAAAAAAAAGTRPVLPPPPIFTPAVAALSFDESCALAVAEECDVNILVVRQQQTDTNGRRVDETVGHFQVMGEWRAQRTKTVVLYQGPAGSSVHYDILKRRMPQFTSYSWPTHEVPPFMRALWGLPPASSLQHQEI